MIEQFFEVSPFYQQLDKQAMELCKPHFEAVDAIRDYNQVKMLKAFTDNRVAATHMMGSTGYGYDDAGRDRLDEVFAQVVGAEDALCRSHFLSGTHALTVALFGLLRAGDTLLAATGRPYDTLEGVIGIGDAGKGFGTLAEYGVAYDEAPLKEDGMPDYQLIAQKAVGATVCHIQRSRGYSSRCAFDLETIGKVIATAKQANPDIVVMVDNCYGEFTQTAEPTSVGADLIVGSLIKNAGGGIAPTGGYVAGRRDLVEKCAHRLTAPGTGRELGCTLDSLRQLYLGLYYAPGVTAEAIKTSIYASCLLELLGKNPLPRYTEPRNDIITSFETGDPQAMVAFCQGIQAGSPVDSYVSPEPYAMPGYTSEVIMAAGAFTNGSSIELSCDGPMRPPYTVYLQGGLNFAASRAGILTAVQRAFGQPDAQ